MFGILVLCLGYYFYVWDISLMFGILVLCLGYLSYVWDISLMSGILVLCLNVAGANRRPKADFLGVCGGGSPHMEAEGRLIVKAWRNVKNKKGPYTMLETTGANF